MHGQRVWLRLGWYARPLHLTVWRLKIHRKIHTNRSQGHTDKQTATPHSAPIHKENEIIRD